MHPFHLCLSTRCTLSLYHNCDSGALSCSPSQITFMLHLINPAFNVPPLSILIPRSYHFHHHPCFPPLSHTTAMTMQSQSLSMSFTAIPYPFLLFHSRCSPLPHPILIIIIMLSPPSPSFPSLMLRSPFPQDEATGHVESFFTIFGRHHHLRYGNQSINKSAWQSMNQSLNVGL